MFLNALFYFSDVASSFVQDCAVKCVSVIKSEEWRVLIRPKRGAFVEASIMERKCSVIQII